MGEYRFGTVAVAASALVVVGALGFAIWQARVPRAAGPAALALAMLVAALGVPRLWRFAANPPTPLAEVDRLWRQKLDAWASALEISSGSAFLADVGAPLWSSSLRVIDAAGLCEPQVIKTLKANGTAVDWRLRSPAFYDWIFETAKPTFVATHLFWTVVTQLDRDPRWLRDYVPIDAYFDSYAQQVYGVTSRSGVWVRRDALIVPRALEGLRALHAAPRSEPLVWRLVDALGGTPPADSAKLAQAAWNARFQERDLHRAATLWQRALEREPDHLANLQLLAETLDAVSRVDEARAVWHRLRKAATRAGAAAPLAAAHDRLDRPDEETDEVLWMNGAIDALYTRGDAAMAIRLLERLLARTPDHYGATFQLARALKLSGRRDEARAQFARSLEMASKIGDEPTAKLAREELVALTDARTLNQ
jgi:tetratricopeptide (TPR) repeat protein